MDLSSASIRSINYLNLHSVQCSVYHYANDKMTRSKLGSSL